MKKSKKKTGKKKTGRRGPRAKTGKPVVESKVKQLSAIQLRLEGFKFREIGEKLGISKQAAYARVCKSLDELSAMVTEQTEHLRLIESERLDQAIRGIWSRATGQKSQAWAVGKLIDLIKSRRALWGLDSPKRLDIQTTEKTHEEWLKELK
jgi:predicted DNA-binding protein (UPF0251 family)